MTFGRTCYEYTDYLAWDAAVNLTMYEFERRFCKDCCHVIEVYDIANPNRLYGYWDCQANAGEVYSY